MEIDDVVGGIADMSLKNLKTRPGDYRNGDGILVCGKCGKPRELYIDLGERRKVGVMCDCDLEIEREEAIRKQREKDMEIVELLRSESLMDGRFKTSTFDVFKETPENAKNLKLCIRYAHGFPEMLQKNQGLLMYGPPGTGKTFSASCIANYLLDRKTPVVVTSIITLIDHIMKRSERTDDIMARIKRVKLLILDDFGAERNSSYAYEQVYKIIDSRYRSGLPMIITTNIDLQDMMAETDNSLARIYDRIFEACFPMEFTGASWRKIEASQRFEKMKRFMEGGD